MEAQHNGSGILQILGRNFESGRHDGERNRQQACALVYPSLRRQAARPLELHCVYSLSDTPQNDTSEKGEVTQQSREQKIRRSALLARAAFCAGAVLTKGHFAFACYSYVCTQWWCQDWGGLLELTLPMDMPERFFGSIGSRGGRFAHSFSRCTRSDRLFGDAPAFRPVQRVGNIASHAILGGLQLPLRTDLGFRYRQPLCRL
jgi:hypothetical protein